jgi:hypothetical protein
VTPARKRIEITIRQAAANKKKKKKKKNKQKKKKEKKIKKERRRAMVSEHPQRAGPLALRREDSFLEEADLGADASRTAPDESQAGRRNTKRPCASVMYG